MSSLLVIIGFVALLLAVGSIFFAVFIARRKLLKSIAKSLNFKLLSVRLPSVSKIEEDPKELISAMETLYTALSGIKFSKQRFFAPKAHIALELAVPHVGEEIVFYVASPARIISDVERQIYSHFPGCQIEAAEDYNIFSPTGVSLASYVATKNNEALPLKTYKGLEVDPLSAITGSLSKLKEVGEGAALQILFRPAPKSAREKGIKIARLLKEGKDLKEAISHANKSGVEKFAESVVPKKEKDEDRIKQVEGVSSDLIKDIEDKSAKTHIEANIRVVVSSNRPSDAEDALRQMENSFGQFANPVGNEFRFVHPKGRALKRLFFNFAYRLWNEKEKLTLSVEELTSIYHFPNVPLATPRIKSAKSRTAEAPVELPKSGLLIGKNIYRNDERKIYVTQEDRRRHMYTIGQTGTGKSTFIKNLIIQDIRAGRGVGLIDPHGDIAEDVLGAVPPERYDDVVLIDPAELSYPVGLNMLQYDPRYPEQKTFIVNELISILDKLYDLKTTGGPMFEQYTRNALLLLMEYPDRGYTLMEIPKVLSDKEFRRGLLENCTNILVRDFWEKEAEKAGGEAALANLAPYITSKFNVFLANDYIRPIISQSKSSIKFREILDNKKILIVSLSKGRLGDINSSLLGLIVVGKILMAAFSRVDTPEKDRQDFYLYIDEFQNFATESIATILSEARKYKLNLMVAHQFIGQLKEEIKKAVFGNVGSILSFRIGAEDAEILAKQFEPVFTEQDLTNLDNFNMYAKLLSGGKTTKPFSMAIYPPEKTSTAVAHEVKQLSISKYGRPKAEVEEEILARIKSQPED